VRSALSNKELQAITQTIRDSEQHHTGEIHFAIENALNWRQLLSGMTSRDRAQDVFSRLRVWDTEHNNGVLIYLLLADRAVEIVADRAAVRRIQPNEWHNICRAMEKSFKTRAYAAGIIVGVRSVGALLAVHFGGEDRSGNELADQPSIVTD
jgi:uncharacterized membrane protein